MRKSEEALLLLQDFASNPVAKDIYWLRQEIENKIDATADNRFWEIMVLCSHIISCKGFLSPRELI